MSVLSSIQTTGSVKEKTSVNFFIFLFLVLFCITKLFSSETNGFENMIIAVGSANKAKILAVTEVIQDSSHFSNSNVIGLEVGSDVSDQPITLQETIQGAKNRAKNAFHKCNCRYSFGIESGLMEAAQTSSGYFHVSVCAIYDGENYYTGLSIGFEIPPLILDLILNKKMDLSQACLQSGISSNTKIGSTEGLIGVLTKGKIDRKEYSKQCVLAAVLQLENYDWYASSKKSSNQ